MSLELRRRFPPTSRAQVRSVSAVGEQYVDLQPDDESPPYLSDGSVIAMSQTSIPQRVGPMLDQVSALVDSLPQDNLGRLLDESFKAFNGAGYDFGSLLDSSAKISGRSQRRRRSDPEARRRQWSAAGLAGAERRLHQAVGAQPGRDNRTVGSGRPASAQVACTRAPDSPLRSRRLLTQIKPTLPILLANLNSVGSDSGDLPRIAGTTAGAAAPQHGYHQAASPRNNPTGLPLGDFALTIGDPPACTVGFLPPSSWRSPADTTTIDTPDGLYCKLPQDSPIGSARRAQLSVHGASR